MVRAEGFGLANVELQVPAKPETIFQSGSVGKQFTATAVMMLVEEGKIGLDDPLTKYFADAPAAWNNVTVRELLSHTAGFGDYPKNFNFRKDWTEDELLKMVEGIPLAYAPGTKWAYSNLGFLTLGILIHRVSGRILWRLSAAANFSSAGDELDENHQRSRHHPQPRCRIPPGKRRIEKSGVGRADGQYDRGWKPLLLRSRSRQVGCRALHREVAEAVKSGSDVDRGQAEKWRAQQRRLRIWLVHRGPERASLHSSRRSLAGIRDGDRPLRGRSIDSRGA